jgi:hypothetical protein
MPVLNYLWIIPLLPLLGAATNGIFGARWPKNTISAVALASTTLAFLAALEAVREFFSLPSDQVPFTKSFFTWISAGGFQADFALRMDQLTVVMLLVVTGVGWLIHIYSTGYMHDDPGYRRFFAYLNLFMFFMLVLILAANYLLLFVGWEGVGLCSYLLVGFYFLKQSATNAGNKAFWVNRVGDFGFLIGLFLMLRTFGSLDFATVLPRAASMAADPAGQVGTLTVIALLLFVGGREIRADSAVRLVAGRDGGPDAGQRSDPRGDDGDRRRLHGRTLTRDFSERAGGHAGGRRDRMRDGALCRNDRPRADRHQESAGLLHGFATRLHVFGMRRGRIRRGHFSLDDARIFQGLALPCRGKRDPRHGRRAGHAQDGRPAHENSGDILDDAHGHARHRGRAGLFRIFQQGRDSR